MFSAKMPPPSQLVPYVFLAHFTGRETFSSNARQVGRLKMIAIMREGLVMNLTTLSKCSEAAEDVTRKSERIAHLSFPCSV